MSRMVPAKYITTLDAIKALGSDGAEKANSLISAAKSQKLPAMALVRHGKEWTEYPLPVEYWEKGAADTALWAGEVDGLGLPAADRWMDGRPLCFRRAEWEAWSSGPVTEQPATADSNDLHDAIRKWFAAEYPNGRTKPWKTLRDECAAALKRPSLSIKTMSQRALKPPRKRTG